MSHYVVCIKQVPDSTQMRIDPETGTLIRQGVPVVINPYDMPAIEAALEVKDRYGGKITVITMGPPLAAESLKECVGMGCDEGIHLTDRLCAGADTLATTKMLATMIERMNDEGERVDLVFTGKQTIDGDTAQVGPGVATRLHYAQLTYVHRIVRIDFELRKMVVQRKLERGIEVVEARLPALLMCLPSMRTFRRQSPEILLGGDAYKPITRGSKDYGLEPTEVGLKGSPTIVAKTFTPTSKKEGIPLKGDWNSVASELIERLIERRKLSAIYGDGRPASAQAGMDAREGAG